VQLYYRKHRMKAVYGLTLEDYDAMLEAQGGVCAICGGGPIGGREKYLCVDHDHETGKVRGLLCGHCNTGIGKLKHDSSILAAAIEYLALHR
jgi:hypothetical protein